ncbi:hypothetical protein [Neolewinella agarilytica]|uniref:hypothetical protein n=1 Tax=Neolewinella agarilytica TaxID=478744 RepID=UPI000B7F77BE|nr:hypothetical protein [Neolewinella agarilytica]
MKHIFNLHSGILFLITAGLPILGFVGGLSTEFILLDLNQGAPFHDSGIGADIFMVSWLIGFLLFHLWALIAGISLSAKGDSLKVKKWAMLTFGLLSLLILLYVTIESFYYLFSLTIATESSAGLSAIRTSADIIVAFGLVLGIWFLPRILFFSFLAILLCHREGHHRWASTALQFFFWPIGLWFLQPRLRKVMMGPIDRAVADHLIH